MKKNIKNLLIILLIILFITLLFLNRLLISHVTTVSFNIWLTKVFPNLFIMFIMQDLLINYNLTKYINAVLGIIFNKLFKTSSNGFIVILLSLIGGSPTNAFVINNLLNMKKISSGEANRLIKFTYFCNPLFLYSMLYLIFNNSESVLKIMFSFYTSNILLGITLPKVDLIKSPINNHKTEIFSNVLINSIKKNIINIIIILGSITFFMIISSIVTLYIDNNLLNTVINGIFEITNGLNSLIDLNVNTTIKEIIATFIISFGGLSIHAQILTFINENKIKYSSFLKGRIFSSIIAILIIILI